MVFLLLIRFSSSVLVSGAADESQSRDPRSGNAGTARKPCSYIEKIVSDARASETVKTVSFNDVSEWASDSDLAAIASLRALEHLDLEKLDVKRYVGGDGKRAVQSRNVGAIEITDSGIGHIAGLPKLRFVTMSKSKVTDRSCRLLSNSKSLQTIGVDGTGVTDRGLMLLAKIPTLRFVSVRDAVVSEDGVNKFKIVRPDVEVLSNYR